MRDNLDITNGLIMSEAVTMGLGADDGPQQARMIASRHLVKKAVKTGTPLIELLAEDKEIAKVRRPQDSWKSWSIRRIISASPARWWIACWQMRK